MPHIQTSSVIETSIDNVWNRIRDFGKLAEWHPLIVESKIEDQRAADSVGCVRRFSLADGSQFREKLLALSDLEHSFSYSIVSCPLPISGYVATVRLHPILASSQTFMTWGGSFQCPEQDEAELIDTVQNAVYQAGLSSLNSQLRKS